MSSRTFPVILGFGASSMEGVGDPEGGFLRRLSARQPGIHNMGIGGQTTRDMLARVDRAVALGATHTIVVLGCNDMPRAHDDWPANRTPLAEYLDNVGTLLSALRAPRSLFISSFLVCPSRTGIAPLLFHHYMTMATATAVHAGYEVWDLYRETRGKTDALLAPDGVHFAAEGHALIAQNVAAWLARP